MPIVIVKESTYEYANLCSHVFEILSGLDRNVIRKDARVLIKPNLLSASRPEKAVTTHPGIIKAVAEYVLSRGARVQVSDSPATGSFQRIITECGIEAALAGMPVTVKPLEGSRKISSKGTFSTIELSEEALEADVIINLPKFKTHAQMALTLAVKNLFGCVVGMRKPEWHYRVGENKELFAELLVSIYRALNPTFNLLDGIMALEGDGPGSGGTPRHVGVLIGSDNALSLDVTVCRMLNIDPFSLLTNKAGLRAGLVEDFEILGKLPSVGSFDIPDIKDLLFGPDFTHGFVRRHVASRPEASPNICALCNECVNMCPSNAITSNGKALAFDYEQCIRCYCCLEVCPHGAIKKRDTLLKRLVTGAARIIRR